MEQKPIASARARYELSAVQKMKKALTVQEGVIVIHRDLTELDLFVRDFLKILKRHSDYLIVSGFVSIATGRTRGTEDVDILVPRMDKRTCGALLKDAQDSGFWCYQGDSLQEVFPYVREMTRIRFARVNHVFPNIELVPFDESKRLQYFEFSHPQKMRVQDFEFKVPPIEFEIVYKEIILGSEKDIADAKHLRAVFSELTREENFKRFEAMVRQNEAR